MKQIVAFVLNNEKNSIYKNLLIHRFDKSVLDLPQL
jgi:hypothetical protein